MVSKGASYTDFEVLSSAIKQWEKENCVNLYVRSSRTVKGKEKSPGRCPGIKPDERLKYYDLCYACVHGGRSGKSQSQGMRPNQRTRITGCSFAIKLKVTADGKALRVTEMSDVNDHNHELVIEKPGRGFRSHRFPKEKQKEPNVLDQSVVTMPMIQSEIQVKEEMVLDTESSSWNSPYEHSEEQSTWTELQFSEHPSILIAKLCKLMYELGWATGASGSVSIKHNDKIYITPSGIQKEMIQPEDIFECNKHGKVINAPPGPLKLSQCAPLFMNAYTKRNAGAVIHSQAEYAVRASLLFKGHEFRISHMEMNKGIKKGSTDKSYKYDDTVLVPIVENVPYEPDLSNRMQRAMDLYPDSNAVLVRRHGVYIWGNTWLNAKAQAECYHYLFRMAVKMKKIGVHPDVPPRNETGIVD